MRHLLPILTILAQIEIACCQNYITEDFLGKWIISDDTIECSSDTRFIEKNTSKTVLFFKDGTLKCSDKNDVIFGTIERWSARENRLHFKHRDGRVSSYASTTLKDFIQFSVETKRKTCGNKESTATLYRKITHVYNAKRTELIGENEVFEESKVDKRPEFKGGEAKKLKWLTDHLKILETDTSTSKPSEITVVFTVDKSGKVVAPMIWGKNLSPELAKIFETTVLTMPKWSPAQIEGVKVNSMVTVLLKL